MVLENLPYEQAREIQRGAPLFEALQQSSQQPGAPFFAPGHKGGGSISRPFRDFLGETLFQADLPELPELGNLFAPSGAIAQAQVLAAATFGAEQTWFLVNGSTCGIMAAILATCGPGDQIILPRNIHRSVINGLIFTGAVPIFLPPIYDQDRDLAASVTPQAVAQALSQYPQAKAVLMVYPTYHGLGGDLGAIVEITHQFNLPLLVDEAHGAHFGFHPELPPSALSLGADLTVQSTHKVLTSLTQSAMVHVQGTRIDRDRLQSCLQLVQSTSPNYLLLASLDVAAQQMAIEGRSLIQKTLDLAVQARTYLSTLPHLTILEPPSSPQPGFKWLDPTRLTVFVGDLGLDGFTVDHILRTQFQVTAELPMYYHLAFIITAGNTPEHLQRLGAAFTYLSQQTPTMKLASASPLPTGTFLGPAPLSPREAFFAPKKTVPFAQSLGLISGELICPYPPGIPVLIPGEIITESALDYLHKVLMAGGEITGCSDPSLEQIKICFGPI